METPQVCSQVISFAREGIKESPLLSVALAVTVGAIALYIFNRSTTQCHNNLNSLHERMTLALEGFSKDVAQYVERAQEKPNTEGASSLPGSDEEIEEHNS